MIFWIISSIVLTLSRSKVSRYVCYFDINNILNFDRNLMIYTSSSSDLYNILVAYSKNNLISQIFFTKQKTVVGFCFLNKQVAKLDKLVYFQKVTLFVTV